MDENINDINFFTSPDVDTKDFLNITFTILVISYLRYLEKNGLPIPNHFKCLQKKDYFNAKN
jgi:hypothetical protein